MEVIMKKVHFLILVGLVFTLISSVSFADEAKQESLLEQKEQRTSVKPKRRAKVLMCHECGKPETQCECEGHGNDNKDHKEDH